MTAVADHVNASLNRILRSGEYVCRPSRQIFVEHTFTNKQGEVTRKVTKDDLDAIAATGNANAANTGDLAPIGIGHTFDDIMDEQGQLVRKFAESEQPKPIGYLHNYSVRQRSDGKWALYADEWIQRTINDERGQPVDGVQYAETFPRRSAEYFPSKRWIDWLALLRRTPALNMGLDIYAFAAVHPERANYIRGSDGAPLLAGVIDARGKWRYSLESDMDTGSGPDGQAEKPVAPEAAAPPAASPAAPADDRPPMEPAANTTDPMQRPEHQQAAERYMAHCTGMHHSQVKPLLHHVHAMYSAQLGLPGDKMAAHVPPPAPAAPVAPQAGAPAPPGGPAPPAAAPAGSPTPMDAGAAPTPPGSEHAKHSPTGPGGLSGDSSWHEKHNVPVAGPGVGPAFIPGSEEHKRMSAVQQGVTDHRVQTQVDKDRYELQQLRESVAAMQTETRKANYERDLTGLMAMGFEFTLSKEVARMEPVRYDKAACDAHVACIKENYQRAPVGRNDGSSVFIEVDPATGAKLPSRAPTAPGGVSREENRKAVQYASEHGVKYEEALVKIRGA